MAQILGIDAGNNAVKIYGGDGEMKFPSDLGEYRELKLKNSLAKDDIIYSYKGVRGFAGTLAQRESEFGGNMMGTSKAHNDMLIRTLIAIHRYSSYGKYDIVVGQPISGHDEEQKNAIKSLLAGKHTFEVNGTVKNINIERVEVAPEGASSFWSAPKKGKIRIIDVGSGTVNFATILDGMYVDRESGTMSFGANTNVSKDIDAFSRKVAIKCLEKWKKTDEVYLVGGKAEELLVSVMFYFKNTKLLKPIVDTDEGKAYLNPIYANAVSYYNIGKRAFGHGL